MNVEIDHAYGGEELIYTMYGEETYTITSRGVDDAPMTPEEDLVAELAYTRMVNSTPETLFDEYDPDDYPGISEERGREIMEEHRALLAEAEDAMIKFVHEYVVRRMRATK